MKVNRSFVFACAVFSLIFGVAGFADAATTLKLAGQNPLEHQNSIQMNRLAEIVDKATKGELKIKTYPAGQLGDYTLVYEEISKGTIDMALITIPPQFDARQQIIFTPYLVADYQGLYKLFDKQGWLYKQVEGFHKKMNIKFLGFFMDGLGGLGLTKAANEPLNPAAKKNVLCRIPNMEIPKETLTAIGFATVTIPYSDLYTALQTGVAEGWFGGSAVHSYLGFRDVVKHYYPMNFYAESEQFIISQKVWDKLSDGQKKLLSDSVDEICKNSIAIAEQEDKMYMKKLEEAGVKVYQYTAKDLDATVAYVRKNVWPKLGDILGKDLTEALIKEYSK
jgi:TRAP-type C4-dicarboxylate transport system substrate-binding protein